jgi:molybdenum-dependent DNA-binding transcriptional regulator ModE
MTKERKIIRGTVGLLELAKQLGNVSQACKMMGYSRDSFYASRSSTTPAANLRCRN